MRFYVSWYPGDPVYSKYDSDCAVLVSASSVAARWKLADLTYIPRWLIIDSGGYRYSATGAPPPTPRQLFERQIQMIKSIESEVTLCALDRPGFATGLTSNDFDRQLSQTLANAFEFKLLAEEFGLPSHIKTMAIVQGYDVASLRYCARELKTIGFDSYGIGSLAFLNDSAKVIQRVCEVTDVLGEGVHIFGVTAGRMLGALSQLDVQSIDSSTPAKAAMYNQLFYSHPFRRFEIAGTRRARQRSMLLSELLPCDCPVCRDGPDADLLKTGKRSYVFLRTLHNYFHLKQTIVALLNDSNPLLV